MKFITQKEYTKLHNECNARSKSLKDSLDTEERELIEFENEYNKSIKLLASVKKKHSIIYDNLCTVKSSIKIIKEEIKENINNTRHIKVSNLSIEMELDKVPKEIFYKENFLRFYNSQKYEIMIVIYFTFIDKKEPENIQKILSSCGFKISLNVIKKRIDYAHEYYSRYLDETIGISCNYAIIGTSGKEISFKISNVYKYFIKKNIIFKSSIGIEDAIYKFFNIFEFEILSLIVRNDNMQYIRDRTEIYNVEKMVAKVKRKLKSEKFLKMI